MSRGAKIALAIVGVALVVLVIVVFVMVEHVDDGTHAASKRVTPDNVEDYDAIVVLPRDASAFAVSDVEERMNRLDAVDEYAEVSRSALAYLLTINDKGRERDELVGRVCTGPTRGYVVTLADATPEGHREFANELGKSATVRSSSTGPTQIELFMRVRATSVQTSAVRTMLESDRDVANIRFLSHQDAYDEFRRMFADEPELINGEPANGSGLPESFRLELRAGASPQTVAARYEDVPGVDAVNVPVTRGVPNETQIDVCQANIDFP